MNGNIIDKLHECYNLMKENEEYYKEYSSKIPTKKHYNVFSSRFTIIIFVICTVCLLGSDDSIFEKIFFFWIYYIPMLLDIPICLIVNKVSEYRYLKSLEINKERTNQLIKNYSQNCKKIDQLEIVNPKYCSMNSIIFLINAYNEGKGKTHKELVCLLDLEIKHKSKMGNYKYFTGYVYNDLFNKGFYDLEGNVSRKPIINTGVKKKKYRKTHKRITKIRDRIKSAEDNIQFDPGTSLMQIRWIAEEITKCIFVCENIETENSHTQLERLKILEKHRIVDKNIIDQMHHIRISGNKAAHSNYDSDKDTISVLDKIKSVYFSFEVKYLIN